MALMSPSVSAFQGRCRLPPMAAVSSTGSSRAAFVSRHGSVQHTHKTQARGLKLPHQSSRLLMPAAGHCSRRGVVVSCRATLFEQLQQAQVVDPADSSVGGALSGIPEQSAAVVVVLMPQLGDFDSAEYAEQLAAVSGDLEQAGVSLRVIAIGGPGAAKRFSGFTGLQMDTIRLDPDAAIHRALGLHEGPGWSVPEGLQQASNGSAEAWLNYMAMCAGIAAPGTLAEIARGYLGDKSAPERIAADAVVKAGPVEVVGTQKWRIGGLGADLWWSGSEGYQRPVELATVRLRSMAEVLGNWSEYVSSPEHLAVRGATFVFEMTSSEQGGAWELAYEWRDRGVLTYSETMARPLSFLEPYIGPRALNPLGLGDVQQKKQPQKVRELER